MEAFIGYTDPQNTYFSLLVIARESNQKYVF